MREFQETVEEIRAEEASVSRLFGGEGVRVRSQRQTPEFMRKLAEAATFVGDIMDGRRPIHHMQEAMSTSDFPLLFANIIDRQLLGAYQEIQPVWQNYIRQSTVPDFRPVQRLAVDGAEGQLPEVDELEEYPLAKLEESEDSYKVRKYGRRIDLSWEAMVNDDLDAFRRNPERLARGARRTEQRFATGLYVDSNGPHGSLYTSGNGNIVTGNPALSIDALQAAMTQLASFSDPDGEPIALDMVHLVTGPGLEVDARNLLNATQVWLGADTAQKRIITNNWMNARFSLHVDPYIPRVATTHGATSWFLFADPNQGRPFAEMGFLRGYESPALYERLGNARLVGGGGEVQESFEDDSVAYRIRHVLGGGTLLNTGGAKATVASNGSGS